MTNEVEDIGPQGCPFLGLEEDRSVMLLDASPLHRCHAVPGENHTPTLQYQSDTCLCEAHKQCPRFQRAVPLGDVVKPPPRSKPRTQRTPMILAGAATLLVLAAIAWLASSFGASDLETAADSRTPTAVSVSQGGDAANTEGAGAATTEGQAPAGSQETAQTEDAGAATAAVTTDVEAGPEDSPGDTPAVTPVETAGGAASGAASGAADSSGGAQDAAAEPSATLGSTASPATATPTPPPATPTAEGGFSLANLLPSPTPVPGSELFQLRPATGNVGWWFDQEPNTPKMNDSFLYAGALNGSSYVSGARFDLSRIARGAPILSGSLTLTGLRDEQLDRNSNATWLVQLIGENDLGFLGGASYMMLFSAPSSVTLQPQLTVDSVGVEQTNVYQFDAFTLEWLEKQRLDGAESIVMRIVGNGDTSANTLFGWDSGQGGVSNGNAPLLQLMMGAAPTATPPLPTRDFVVATFTPVPANVLTVEAQQALATAVAETTGTYTPMPFFVTPTSQPQNLATVQAAARLAGLPAVVLETPVPANEATATEMAAYATAVAATTGTFTPVPTAYVTPFKVLPSPPAENLLTVVARSAEATAVAELGGPTSTPLPYNAVIAEFVVATVTPLNVATAAAMVQEATAAAAVGGTATPTPWEWVVLPPTPLPTEVPPTPTPTLPPLILERDFTPTPTPLPGSVEVAPDVLPSEFVNKIIFRTDRTGAEEVFLIDPASGDTGKVTRDWVYPLAQQQLAVSPDGKKIAVVKEDNQRILQIFVRSLEYGTDTQITSFARDSYDPTWSPTGEWIAFVGTNSGNDEIYRVSPDGATVQQLTKNQYEWDKHPTWSPDGTQILFFSNRETGRRQLWIMDADGDGQRNYTSDQYENWDPIWTR